jgi:hypothetical protein
VEGEACIGDALATGPPDVGKPVGDGLGQDDVGRPRDQPLGEPRPAGGPGVDGDHGRGGQHLAVTGARSRAHADRSDPPAVPAARRRSTRASPELAERPRPHPVDLDDLAAFRDHDAAFQ